MSILRRTQNGGSKPWPLSVTINGARVGAIVRYDFSHLGKGKVTEPVDSTDGFMYMLVAQVTKKMC